KRKEIFFSMDTRERKPFAYTYTTNTHYPSPMMHHHITPLFKLVLGNALPHRGRAAKAAGHHLLQLIHVVRPAPLLVLHHVDAQVDLRLLHQLAVRPHALLAESACESVADQRRRVQARQRDELPA